VQSCIAEERALQRKAPGGGGRGTVERIGEKVEVTGGGGGNPPGGGGGIPFIEGGGGPPVSPG